MANDQKIQKITSGTLDTLTRDDDNSSMLYAVNLYDKIAVKFLIPEEHVGGIAVAVSPKSLYAIFQKYLSQGLAIKATIVGGDNETDSQKYAKELEETFNKLKTEYTDMISTDFHVNSVIHDNGIFLLGEELAHL